MPAATHANGHATRNARGSSKRADISLPPMPDFMSEEAVETKDLDTGFGSFSLTQKAGPVESPKTLINKLLDSASTRQQLAELIKENYNTANGHRAILSWLRDEGYDASLPCMVEALEAAKASDLLFWASRYHMFVSWSTDGQHPWDKLDNSEAAAATLEIGRLPGSEDKAVVLLNSAPVEGYTFQNGILRTTAPVAWKTPAGETARVHLNIQFSAFASYGRAEAHSAYLGLQAHGILWAAEAVMPALWPVTPPQVAGKVNVAARQAAISPRAIDELSVFEGNYAMRYVNSAAGAPSVELAIVKHGERMVVILNGKEVPGAQFAYNSVMTWADSAGCSAWLQFMVLPGGPAFAGKLHRAGESELSGPYNVVGEVAGQPSQVSPDGTLNVAVAEQVAAGLASASAAVLAHVLKAANEHWGALATESGGERERRMLAAAIESGLAVLGRMGEVGAAAEAAFPHGPAVRELDPHQGAAAAQAQADASAHAQAAVKAAGEAGEALKATSEAIEAQDVVDATHCASVTAWHAGKAADAAAKAEASAVGAASQARAARTHGALAAAMIAAQSYNQARGAAAKAARCCAEAAGASMAAVESNVTLYVAKRDYLRLKEMAEASDIAGKALSASKRAQQGWEAGSAEGRRAACEAARQAFDLTTATNKVLRAVQ